MVKTLVLITSLFLTINVSAKEIHFAYGDYNTAPYIISNNKGEVTGGILFDIAKFTSSQLNMAFRMVNTPRTRVIDMLEKGHIDIYCNFKKEWSHHQENFDWFSDISEDQNQIYTHVSNKTADIRELNDINTPIGTISGFVYLPEIEALVEFIIT